MRILEKKRTARALTALANAIWRHPWLFLMPQALLFALCLAYTFSRLEFSTARADLVSETVKYQRDYLEYKREFQNPDALVAIVESESLEKNRRFMERLAFKLSSEPGLFQNTYYKGDLRLMGEKGLLFLSEASLLELRKILQEEWAFIEAFAEADGLVPLIRFANQIFREGNPGGLTDEQVRELVPALEVFERLVDEAADSLETPLPNSFPGLVALFGEQTRLYLTFGGGQIYALVTHAARPEVETKAVQKLREFVRETRNEIPGVNAGISGEPVLNFDEMTQAQQDISIASVISTGVVALIFIFGFHEVRRPVLATLCLLVGVGYALGFATLSVGRLNILSITLLPILIGLAIDFGVHLISRYEEELRRGCTSKTALQHALAFTGIGILTSGLTTAGAFLAMLLTDFKGIQEMGFIAGTGLLFCLGAMMTLLPALLSRSPATAENGTVPWQKWQLRKRIEGVALRSPALVVSISALLTVLALTQFPRLDFDYNLLNLQSSDLPAVGIEEKLIESGSESLLRGVVIADSLAEAGQLQARIEQLEPVAKVDSLVNYLTDSQSGKLAIIRDIQNRLRRLEMSHADEAPVDLAALNEALFAFQGYLGLALQELRQRPGASAATRQVESLRDAVLRLRSHLENPTAATRLRLTEFQRTLYGNLRETIGIIREQDTSGGLTLADIPPFLRERYYSPSGRFLLEVHPKKDLWQRENQKEFLAALRTVDPDVTGTIVQVFEYTSLIKENFLRASAYAAGIIAVLLLLQFRRILAAMIAFLPVLVGLCWTLGAMAWLGISFNPVNIMALTLLIGIGVPNGIHILQRFAEDPRPAILSQSTGKAVVVSALTTIAGFGSLLVAKHQGIASLGKVMAIGTFMCLVASLVVLPALLLLFSRMNLFKARPPAGK